MNMLEALDLRVGVRKTQKKDENGEYNSPTLELFLSTIDLRLVSIYCLHELLIELLTINCHYQHYQMKFKGF